jgi:hypothetical protein
MAKVKNIAINIQIGKREYCFKNLILDILLNNYAESLVDNYESIFKSLQNCCISFSPLEIKEDMVITNDTFDIGLFSCISKTIGSQNKITNKYVYTSEDDCIYDYTKKTADNIKLKDYIGKKICTLGFSYFFTPKWNTTAILDVSNYDIYIQEGEELRITRIDEISTDAIFTSLHENINSPIHLYPNGIPGIFPKKEYWNKEHTSGVTVYYNAYAKLTNFGFGNTPNNVEIEYDIEGNYEVNNNMFCIKNIWSPKGVYPNNELYPSVDLYPDSDKFNFLILRFKLFQKVAEEDATFEDVINDKKIINKFTGAEYLQAIPLDKRGNVDLNIKYERG